MNHWRTLYHLMRADLFERARRYSLLITLGFIIFAAYVYISPKEAHYLTLGLGNYRGVYADPRGCVVDVLDRHRHLARPGRPGSPTPGSDVVTQSAVKVKS